MIDTAKNKRIRDGLMVLCAEVLFVRDRIEFNKFHPRITAQYTYSFRYLDDNTKNAFNRLYDDFFIAATIIFGVNRRWKNCPNSSPPLPCWHVGKIWEWFRIVCLRWWMNWRFWVWKFSECQKSACSVFRFGSIALFVGMHNIYSWYVANSSLVERKQGGYTDLFQLCASSSRSGSRRMYSRFVQNDFAETPRFYCNVGNSSLAGLDVDWRSITQSEWSSRANQCSCNPDHYWCYKMHLSLEKLLQADSLNSEIGKMSTRNR